jgi:hypothetical protein
VLLSNVIKMNKPLAFLLILIAASASIEVAYYFYAIVILDLPSYRYPYWFSILGVLVVNVLAVKFWFDGEAKSAYVMAFLNLFIALGLLLIIIAEMLGSNSSFYQFMHSRPFAN